jgi:hypothetical protein
MTLSKKEWIMLVYAVTVITAMIIADFAILAGWRPNGG